MKKPAKSSSPSALSPRAQARLGRAIRKIGGNALIQSNPYGGFYDAATGSRFRQMGYVPALDETRMMPFPTRLVIIGYMRRQIRNDPILAAIQLRHALGIGYPTFHSTTSDPEYNRAKDDYLQWVFKRIGFANGESFKLVNFMISCEEFITGECFAVKTQNGKLQLIPAELVGSPAGLGIMPQEPPGEIQGIFYDANNTKTAYRIGKRMAGGYISYDEKDGARIIPAQYVYQLGTPTRIEERRPIPRMTCALPEIVDLADTRRTRAVAWKLQSAVMMFITKNFSPELIREINAASGGDDAFNTFVSDIFNKYRVNSGYDTLRAGEIMYGLPGEEAKLLAPPFNSEDFTQYEMSRIERITRVLGMPAEEITSYRRSNYSSSRADKLGWVDAIDNERDEREKFLDDIQVWQSNRGQFFDKLDSGPQDEEHLINWTWPPLPAIDETKTAASQIARLTAGTATIKTIAGENGGDGESLQIEIVKQAARYARLIKVETEPDIYGKMPFDQIPVTAQELQPFLPNAESTTRAVQNLKSADSSGGSSSGGSSSGDGGGSGDGSGDGGGAGGE